MSYPIPSAMLLAAALLACGSAAPARDGGAAETAIAGSEEIPLETIEQRSVPGKVGDRVREVIRDAATWQRVWTDLASRTGSPEEAPAVDFGDRMVIAAAMPTQPCVSRVTIRSVRAEGDGLVVDLLEQPPAEGVVCIVSERPFHVVSLARRGGPVRWNVEQRPLDPSVR